MAEDLGDKTEAPTQRRREEAREQGNVARSPDLTAAALLLGGLVLLNWYGANLFAAMGSMVRHMLSESSFASIDSQTAGDGILASLAIVGRAMLPLLAGLVIV